MDQRTKRPARHVPVYKVYGLVQPGPCSHPSQLAAHLFVFVQQEKGTREERRASACVYGSVVAVSSRKCQAMPLSVVRWSGVVLELRL